MLGAALRYVWQHPRRFELDRAWVALKSGGAPVVDDIDSNGGYGSFLPSIFWISGTGMRVRTGPARRTAL
jgi:hypothetical protein